MSFYDYLDLNRNINQRQDTPRKNVPEQNFTSVSVNITDKARDTFWANIIIT